ncbi:MAG TPA: hypothetical protein GX497_03550, partial [Bacillus bacterium]|nr:hypothetical protein [Bacillus sp. (in: firmicutes)]
MNKTFQWILFLVIGVVLGFMGSLLFNGGEKTSTEPPLQTETATSTKPAEPTEPTDTAGNNADTEQPNLAEHTDNVLFKKGCIACHAV